MSRACPHRAGAAWDTRAPSSPRSETAHSRRRRSCATRGSWWRPARRSWARRCSRHSRSRHGVPCSPEMAKPKVVITRKIPAAAEERARGLFDVELNANDTPLDGAGLARAMREADGLLPCVADKITADILGTPGRRAKIVANYGVGYNNIDIAAAKENGVVVTNTPDVL